MFENYYILKNGEYYLSNLNYDKDNRLYDFEISKEYKKIYSDFEKAESERKIVYIEIGLDLEIKKLKEVI